jgi:hypothetical protein
LQQPSAINPDASLLDADAVLDNPCSAVALQPQAKPFSLSSNTICSRLDRYLRVPFVQARLVAPIKLNWETPATPQRACDALANRLAPSCLFRQRRMGPSGMSAIFGVPIPTELCAK